MSPDDGWTRPLPARTTRPTYWPAGLALGVTTALWGLVTSPVVGVVGALVGAGSLVGWVRELVRDDDDARQDEPRRDDARRADTAARDDEREAPRDDAANSESQGDEG